ncbi:MAG: XdhC family protein, partial [Gemmatimonadales bacterium]
MSAGARRAPADTSEAARVRRALLGELAAGRPVALATMVGQKGSTPRKSGARMLV